MPPRRTVAAPPPPPEPTEEELRIRTANEPNRVVAVLMEMLEQHPFWGYLLLQLQAIPNPELPAMAATDCIRRVWYNPRMTCCLTTRQLGFVLVHELGHHVYETLDRERGRDRQYWNQATDYAINRIVADIPDPAERWRGKPMYDPPIGKIPGLGDIQILLDKRFDGKIAELIYEELLDEDSGVGSGPTAVDVPLGEGVVMPGVPDHGGGIDVHLPDMRTPEQREEAIDRIRAAIEYWKEHDQRGDLPGRVRRNFLTGKSVVPWQRVFRQFVSQARSRDEYEPRRPNRKWLEAGTIVPSRGGETMGTVVVALDTSQSMTGALLNAFAAEIRALSREVEDLRVVVCDAVVQETLDMDDLAAWLKRGNAKGGGGTSHIPVFDWICEQRIDPEVFIGLTDLESVFPKRAPGFPVLWVAPEKHGKAPFGKVIVAE